VEEKHQAHQGDDDQFLDQLLPQIGDRIQDQRGTIIGGENLHPRRQAGLEFFQLGLDRGDGRQGVLPLAHDDDAAGHLPLPVQLRNRPAHLGADLHPGQVTQQDGRTVRAHIDGDGLDVRDRGDIAPAAHHVLRLRQLQHRAADLLIGGADGLGQVAEGDAVGAQALRVHHHLVLADHAAHRRHLRHPRDGLQLQLEEPVLEAAQLGQIPLAAPVHQGVAEHPADPGGIRSQAGNGPLRELAGDLAEILQHAGAGPVEVCAIGEQHVDVGVAEQAVAAHRDRPRHRQQGGGEGIGDLVLHHPRRLPREAGADDDLDIGQVGDGIQGRLAQGLEAPGRQQQGGEQDQEAVADGPVNQVLHDRALASGAGTRIASDR
jgi:hypothetical protein